MVKISVILPVYRVSVDYLKECLDSLLKQSMQDCEFIIVSDGASERVQSLCSSYAFNDSRFYFFVRPPKGVSSARNYGLRHAHGEYITFVDADDWVEQDYLDDVYKTATKNRSDILCWNYMLEGITSEQQVYPLLKGDISHFNPMQKNQALNNIIINQEFGQSLSTCWSKLYRKTFLDKNNLIFCEDLNIGEDKVFNYKAFLLADNISYSNKIFYHYRMHGESAVHKFIPNALSVYLKYLEHIDNISIKESQNSLGKEFFNIYQHALQYSYFPKGQSISALFKNIRQLKKIVSSESFHHFLCYTDRRNYGHIDRLHLLCLKYNSLLPIYILIITYAIVRYKSV